MNPAPQPLPHYAGAPLLLLIIAFLMMQPLSTDLYLASLPSLATVFDVPPSTVQLTLSLFVIGFGGAQLIIGPLSDRFGRRPVLLYGLALYVVSSALCGFAPSIELLIVARFLQALGCCAAVIIARAIVRDAYHPEHSARVVARASSWLSLAPLLGPILGSYLQVAFGWRAAFAAVGLFSAALLVLAAMFLTMGTQSINFPIAQSGAVSPFLQQAGTTAGLLGAVSMAIAFVVGTAVGATHNGTLYPLVTIVCALGMLIFISARMLASQPVAAS